MKFVIRPYSNPLWIDKFLPGVNLLELSICNKPLLDYYFDFLYLLGVKEVLIILPIYQSKIFKFVERESEWGISIRVEIALDEESFISIENRYSTFFSNQKYGIIEGAIFLEYNQTQLDFFDELKRKNYIKFNKQIHSGISVTELTSVKVYFDLCMQLVGKDFKNYSLPGFGSLNGGSIGKGVILKNVDSISRLVNLGNFVLVHQNSIIKSGAIIGSHVVIEEVAEIENSIIYDNAVIGEGVFIKNKIIYNDRIICPLSQEYVKADKKLLLPLIDRSSYKSLVVRFAQIFLSFLFLLMSFPGWILFRFFSSFVNDEIYYKDKVYDRHGEVFYLKKIKGDFLKNKPFFKIIVSVFYLNYFSGFLSVIRGKLGLIGADRLIKKRLGFRDQSSSIFYYSSLIKDPDLLDYRGVVDSFYLLQAKVFLDIYALFKIIFSRIIILIR